MGDSAVLDPIIWIVSHIHKPSRRIGSIQRGAAHPLDVCSNASPCAIRRPIHIKPHQGRRRRLTILDLPTTVGTSRSLLVIVMCGSSKSTHARDITLEGLRKAFVPGRNPSFATATKEAKALGFRLTRAPMGELLARIKTCRLEWTPPRTSCAHLI